MVRVNGTLCGTLVVALCSHLNVNQLSTPTMQLQQTQSAAVALCVCVLAVGLAGLPPMTVKLWSVLTASLAEVQHLPATAEVPVLCHKAKPPYICAHGGDTTKHPPNTATAFTAAQHAGADCMEVDASLTADLQLVAVHDRDLQKLLGRQDVKVQDFTWAELQGLRWPSGEVLMTLVDAVAHVKPLAELVIIDLKPSDDVSRVLMASNGSAVTESDVFVAALQQLPLGSNTVVWGKSDLILQHIQQSGLPVSIGYVLMRAPGTQMESPSRLLHAQVAGVFHGMLDKPLAQLLQAQQEKVMVWTVDAPADAERMLALGVDGIVTNAPALLRATLESALLSCTKAVASTRR